MHKLEVRLTLTEDIHAVYKVNHLVDDYAHIEGQLFINRKGTDITIGDAQIVVLPMHLLREIVKKVDS